MTAQEYLAQHGITEETVKQFNLTSDKNYLHIPVKNEEGKLLFTKSRNLNYKEGSTEPKYKNQTNSHATLFNWHAVKSSPNILLTEGELDCMRLVQSGIPATSSTGGSQTFLPEWAGLFKEKNVWIVFDTDRAGKEGTRAILAQIPHARVVTLPRDVKDVCEFFYKGHTQKEFVNLIQLALNKQEWEIVNLPEEFTILSAKDFEEMEEDKTPWLIENVLYPEGFCFIYGTEGTGKSFITMDMAKAVATGAPWLSHFKTTKTNILFLDKENPQSIIKKRIAGLGINSTDTPNIYWLKYPEKFSLADSKGGYSAFAQALINVVSDKKIGLIIFDSFVDFMVGNESSSGDTQQFFDAIRELYAKIAYITIHHENKPAQGVPRSDSQKLRGSTNINAQTVTMFRLEAVAKSNTEMTLKQTKNRDAPKINKFMIKMNIQVNEDQSTVVTGFDYVGDVEDLNEEKNEEAKESIVEILNSNNGLYNRKGLIELLNGQGISERTTERAIKGMFDEKIISKIRKGKEIIIVLNRPIVENNDFDGGLGL